MYQQINQQRVGNAIAGMSNKSAPGEDRMGAEVVKLLWDWDPRRITALTRGAIRTGYHPRAWKTARGIVIPKPGKPDYSKARAYRVIALLNSLGKVVEKVAADIIADSLDQMAAAREDHAHKEQQWKAEWTNDHSYPQPCQGPDATLHRGQYGCGKRRSRVNAVAVMLNRARTAWGERKIAGALLMYVKSAFNSVARGHLVRRLESMGIEPDICRWVESFMTDRNVRIVMHRWNLRTGPGCGDGYPPSFSRYTSQGSLRRWNGRRDLWWTTWPGWPPVKMLRK